jgi:hypothetical protein
MREEEGHALHSVDWLEELVQHQTSQVSCKLPAWIMVFIENTLFVSFEPTGADDLREGAKAEETCVYCPTIRGRREAEV